ncbi:MAG: Palmitoyltransferase zdhhc13 [Bogoriella megaspora]|nr:MAG: Palmitoyltransferase zdhhc13 [Bogoriella megaspora]
MANAIQEFRLFLKAAHRWRRAYETSRNLCTECMHNSRRPVIGLGETWSRRRVKSTRRPKSGLSVRSYATVTHQNPHARGPLEEYGERVYAGRLREDEHQRTIIQSLQDLHESLAEYRPPKVIHPTVESLKPRRSLLGSLFHPGSKKHKLQIPTNLPKGLYMYGDVGSGKTMLMDLFYDTLPNNIQSKTRIHFHNFMQDVHKELHKMAMAHGNDLDGIPFVAASIAERSSVLCFDEFQVTDVADAMILRRLIEALMAHGCVLVTTSNRHPTDLYKNGIQRQSFVPCITLLQRQLRVLNLDSETDYRKIPRPPSGVYHHPLDKAASSHADRWFRFLGNPELDPPHPQTLSVWGRDVQVPLASGRCARFTFNELIGRATGAADYLELMRSFEAFVVTDVPGMTLRERDWARRFITFIDAVYESRAKLVLTTAVPLQNLFMSEDELSQIVHSSPNSDVQKTLHDDSGQDVESATRMMMDDLGLSMAALKDSSLFSGDEERFAFARALSRLSEMGSQEWVERGLGMEQRGGKEEKEGWQVVRSRWREDSL